MWLSLKAKRVNVKKGVTGYINNGLFDMSITDIITLVLWGQK
jgi:hypothetical protein